MCKTILNRFILIVGFFVFIIVTSCQKSLITDIELTKSTNVTFRVGGVSNKSNKAKLAGNASLRAIGNNISQSSSSIKVNKSLPNVSLDLFNEISDIGFSYDAFNPEELRKSASRSPMVEGRKFRIVILDNLTDTIVKTVQASVDKGVNIDLVVGPQYKWYAYSYNDEQDIPIPSNEDQNIVTPTDRDFLYAKGDSPFTVGEEGEVSIDILFEHQLALLSIELDYSKLYATIPTNGLDWSFETVPDFLYKGNFSLKTGEVSGHQRYDDDIDLNIGVKNHPTDENVKISEYYFVSAPPGVAVSNSLEISLNSLNVDFVNGKSNVVVIENRVVNTFSSISDIKGEKYVAKMRLRYQLPKKLILHVTATDSDDDHKMALAAQPYARDLSVAWSAAPEDNRPPFNMIKAARNYGTLDNSVVYAEGFDHMRCSVDGTLDQKLTIAGQIPDIVILSVHYAMDSNDITALINYLNNGGVLIMFTAYNGHDADRIGVRDFMRTLFNNNSINLVSNIYGNASLFEIDHQRKIDDMITNGPFGDLRGKYWGVDYYNVIQMTGIPSNMVTTYSNPSADNRSNTTTALSMFKHNSLNFFWIGNGGFLSGPNWNLIGGWNNEWGKEPFATVLLPNSSNSNPEFNYNFYPMPKKYGRDYNHPTLGRIGYSYGSEIYNAPLFANLMAWAMYQAEFFGVNKWN